MALGWDESDVKRDARGRFARFESGGVPDMEFVDSPGDFCNEQFNPDAVPQPIRDTYRAYKGSKYVEVNDGLRGRAPVTPNGERITNELTELMDHNRTTQEIWVTRAMKPDAFGGKGPDELVGSTFLDPGFMSTTLTEQLPPQFTYKGKDKEQHYPITLRLKVPEGTPAYGDAANDVLKENELTLAPGRTYDITGVREVGNGEWEVFAEIAPEKSPPPPKVVAAESTDGKGLTGDDLFEYITGKPKSQSDDPWHDFTDALKKDGSIFSRIDEPALEELWASLR